MDKQEMLNTVVPFLIRQGKPSMNTKMKCMYRGPDGTKCAIGCMIPDDKYNPSFDICKPLALIMKQMPEVLGDDIIFLRSVQKCHDEAGVHYFVPVMLGLFKELAEDYRLVWNNEWKVETGA